MLARRRHRQPPLHKSSTCIAFIVMCEVGCEVKFWTWAPIVCMSPPPPPPTMTPHKHGNLTIFFCPTACSLAGLFARPLLMSLLLPNFSLQWKEVVCLRLFKWRWLRSHQHRRRHRLLNEQAVGQLARLTVAGRQVNINTSLYVADRNDDDVASGKMINVHVFLMLPPQARASMCTIGPNLS